MFPLVSVLLLSLYLEGGVWRTVGFVLAAGSVAWMAFTWMFKRMPR